MASHSKAFPRRPQPGTVGQPIRLRTNHFRLTDIPALKVYQYAVEIHIEGFPEERRIPMKTARAIASTPDLLGHLGTAQKTFIYDGRSLAWSKDLIPNFEAEVTRGKRKAKFVLKQTTTISLGVIKQFLQSRTGTSDKISEAMNFLNHLFAAGPTQSLIPVGRKFFTYDNADIKYESTPGVIEFRRGVYQSVHFGGQESLTLNLDVTTGVFWRSHLQGGREMTALDLAAVILRKSPQQVNTTLTHHDISLLSKMMKGVRYYVTHRSADYKKREHSIAKVVKLSARDYKFQLNDERRRTVSVAEYMKSAYNKNLQFPDAPLLMKGDSTYMPMEMCFIVPCQRYPKALNEAQAQGMIKAASSKPDVRAGDIIAKKGKLAHNNDSFLNAYGIKVAANLAILNGRKLPTPQLDFGRNQRVNVTPGQWDSRQAVFKEGVTLNSWGVLIFGNVRGLDEPVNSFVKTLCQTADEKGMRINQRSPRKFYANQSWTPDEVIKRLRGEIWRHLCGNKGPLELLLVITPAKSCQVYAPIKRYCDCVAGIVSQCVASINVKTKSRDRGFAFNMLMKINSKLGGVNVSIKPMPEVLKPGTVFLGADVTHPAPGAPPTRASLATMTGSIDPLASRYAAVATNQTHRRETIVDAENMAKSLLAEYQKACKMAPSRIIYLRDGVSDGQYPQILDEELRAIQRAAVSIAKSKPVTITVIIAKKRHHTRLFPNVPNEGDKNGNVHPGTVVDTGIVHPVEFDFFLVPHKAFQGTVRPAHYHVIYDENNFTSNAIQNLIHQQSYAFARSSTSVSLHPAVYYAHLAGNRARVHDETLGLEDDDTTTVSGTQEDVPVTPLTPMHSRLAGGNLAMWYL